jgi:hypothetical protein
MERVKRIARRTIAQLSRSDRQFLLISIVTAIFGNRTNCGRGGV